MVTRWPQLMLLWAVALTGLGCSTEIVVVGAGGGGAAAAGGSANTGGDTGGGGAGGAPMKIDDPCEDVPFEGGESCCEAGCAAAIISDTAVCVDASRQCYFQTTVQLWERACAPGYECVTFHAGFPYLDPCQVGEMSDVPVRGFCFWKGDEP